MLSTQQEDGARIINDENLPYPYPARKLPLLTDLSFASLGWINRAAQAVGSDRFVETARRARFYIREATGHAITPAEAAVMEGLSATVDALDEADAEARALLGEAVSGLSEAFATDVVEYLQSADQVCGSAKGDEMGELRVTWGDSDRRAGTTSVHKSVSRPGTVWVVVVNRQRVDEWRALWYFGTRELAEDGKRRAVGRDGNGGRVLEAAVVEGRAYFRGSL